MKLTTGHLEAVVLMLAFAFFAVAAIGKWDRAKQQPIDPGLCHIAGGQVIHTSRGTLCSKGTT